MSTRSWSRSLRKMGRRALACTLGLALVAPASATWSIVVLNRVTGEVAVGTSTCLANFDISHYVPVVRVGVAAAASQSFVDPNGRNKRRIFRTAVREGATPADIFGVLSTLDANRLHLRQFGIVTFSGPPVTHSGTSNFDYAGGVVGQVGPYDYAIQGNILTGANVVDDCEAAFLGTQGDLGEKMMAAMEAARDAGGDGRCSCTTGSATTCGSPPPSFNYASYNGYMVIARHGDVDAVACTGNDGSCVGGDYYMELNVVSNAQGPEPVAELRQLYDAWRAGQVGRPDHVKTEVSQTMPRLRADGVSRSSVTVRLRDIDGNAITTGLPISVNAKSGQGNIVTVEDLVDNGDGTFTFDFQATQMTGAAEYVVVVDDGVRPVEMYPPLRLSSVAPEELHLGLEEIRISEPTELPMIIDLGVNAVASPYRILGSVSGTAPSTIFAGVSMPLARDRFFDFTESWAGGAPFTGNAGFLDPFGRAQARLDFPAGALTSIVGATMHFSAWTGVTTAASTAPQGIQIVP